MKRSMKISMIIFILTFILTVISYIFLPDPVQFMHSAKTEYTGYISKLIAIIIDAVLGIIGALGILVSKKEDYEHTKYNTMIISAIGILHLLYMLIVNCLF